MRMPRGARPKRLWSFLSQATPSGEQLTDTMMAAFDPLPAQQPEEVPAAPAAGAAQGTQLLIDQFLPRYDFAVVHAQVFRVPPEVCLRAARNLDLFRHPAIRVLLDLRALPQHAASRVTGRRGGRGPRPRHVPQSKPASDTTTTPIATRVEATSVRRSVTTRGTAARAGRLALPPS